MSPTSWENYGPLTIFCTFSPHGINFYFPFPLVFCLWAIWSRGSQYVSTLTRQLNPDLIFELVGTSVAQIIKTCSYWDVVKLWIQVKLELSPKSTALPICFTEMRDEGQRGSYTSPFQTILSKSVLTANIHLPPRPGTAVGAHHTTVPRGPGEHRPPEHHTRLLQRRAPRYFGGAWAFTDARAHSGNI